MDRQDIDALLVGALYGELTPADEARLAAHLESHPADRGALDDLKVARQAVLDSRIFAVQLEPPQAVSALLLQEAHRRAPKKVAERDENEGWFARFARNFMAHPAMAAAAMLVLVMGGAGIVWMKKGDSQFADKEYAQSSAESADQRAASAPTTAATPVLPEGNAAVAAGSAYGADLYEGAAGAADQGDPAAADGEQAELENMLDAKQQVEQQRTALERNRQETSKSKRAVAVTVDADRSPKDLAERKATKATKNDSAEDSVADKAALAKPSAKGGAFGTATGAAGGGGRGAPGAAGLDFASDTANAVSGAGAAPRGDTAGYAQPPPPAASTPAPAPAPAGPVANKPAPTKAPAPAPAQTVTKAPAAPKQAEKPAESTVTAAPTSPKAEPAPAKQAKKEDAKKDESSLIAWAKSEHQRAVALAKGGNCQAAAQVALAVSNRASSYYSQYMATDRSLKACAQYINAERDKEAERSQKARASKRVNADEPAPTTTK